MFTTLVISLREFLEVFLIIGVFLGISKKLKLHKEKEIAVAATIGVIISVAFSAIVFFVGSNATQLFTEKNTDLLEGYLMIFSGFFIAYVVFSLHKFFVLKRSKALIEAHQKLQQEAFDVSLFFTIIFFVLREGFEIALFTATVALFTQFVDNMTGLLLGLLISALIGLSSFLAYIKLSIGKVFRITEYAIIVLGASFVMNGLTELFDFYTHIKLNMIVPLPLSFLPSSETFIGHLLKNFTGVANEFSLLQLTIMLAYIIGVVVFMKKKRFV